MRSEVILALTGMGDSLSSKVEGLTRSNDQKLELLRSAVEQRLDAFTGESGRNFDSLTESVVTSSARLQSEVSVKLEEFKVSLADTVRETHQLQRDQTEQISASLQSFQNRIDDRLLGLQTAIDTKLSTIEQQTGQKLTDVEAALRNQSQQLREETGASFMSLGDRILTTLTFV